MGDMADDFGAMKAHRQQQHADWKQRNLAVLNASAVIFTTTNYGETLLFRESGKPRVDFYPSTGRWRVAGLTKTFRGGATSFLQWYEKQNS
jgi:hypothetical protein